MKITLIGGQGQGKTFFLTSLHKMSTDIGRNGFHVQPKNFIDPKTFNPKFLWNQQSIQSSQSIREADLVLKRKEVVVRPITIIDVIGQAITGITDARIEDAKAIIQHVTDSDAIAIIVTAPHDNETLSQAQTELAQAHNFCTTLFEKTSNKIPIALILTKIDAMPKAKDIGGKIDALDKKLRDSYTDYREYKKYIYKERGKEVSKLLIPIITDNMYLYELINSFFNIFRSDIPLRVFPSTNIGFGVEIDEGEVKIVNPYGTAAAMLWLVYAHYLSGDALKRAGFPVEEILADLNDIFTSGKAFFLDSDPIWNLRNVSDPFSNPNL